MPRIGGFRPARDDRGAPPFSLSAAESASFRLRTPGIIGFLHKKSIIPTNRIPENVQAVNRHFSLTFF